MKKIGSKIYYLKPNGNKILEIGDMMGYVVETSFDEDYENYKVLKQYEKDKIGYIQLEYGRLSKLLEENKSNSYKVDVSSEPHKLIFEWIDYETGKPTEPPKTTEELIKEEADKVRLEYAVAVAELTEKIEKDKVELSTAIVEAIEMKAGGTV
ncbi:hypothetical protein HMPREF0631_1393 [Peptostreptococcus anaerobius 653-L]|uniref:Uncharacterized protein n=1 Tax=Peptostreptococcus anaerobius 653-L TaxID=596329 RepID=D3MU87_9FIRM|nr:hypothetical protein [Peptostreptococcus anaerobius]EFD04414.1 hypothetical protein HMPREF0631_1393 [Peptostreptococcus anaerobius 653-L]